MDAVERWTAEARVKRDLAVTSRALIDESVIRFRSNGGDATTMVRNRLGQEIAEWMQFLGEAHSPDRPLA